MAALHETITSFLNSIFKFVSALIVLIVLAATSLLIFSHFPERRIIINHFENFSSISDDSNLERRFNSFLAASLNRIQTIASTELDTIELINESQKNSLKVEILDSGFTLDTIRHSIRNIFGAPDIIVDGRFYCRTTTIDNCLTENVVLQISVNNGFNTDNINIADNDSFEEIIDDASMRIQNSVDPYIISLYHFKMGDIASARKVTNYSILYDHKTLSKIQNLLGIISMGEKNFSQAEFHFLKSLYLNSYFDIAQYNLAILYRSTNKFTEYYNLMLDLYKKRTSLFDVYINLSLFHFDQLDLRRIETKNKFRNRGYYHLYMATKMASRSIDIDRNSIEPYLIKILSKVDQHNLDETEETLIEYNLLFSESWHAGYYYGLFLSGLGRFDQSAKILTTASRKDAPKKVFDLLITNLARANRCDEIDSVLARYQTRNSNAKIELSDIESACQPALPKSP